MWPNRCIFWPLMKLVTGASSNISYTAAVYYIICPPPVPRGLIDDRFTYFPPYSVLESPRVSLCLFGRRRNENSNYFFAQRIKF